LAALHNISQSLPLLKQTTSHAELDNKFSPVFFGKEVRAKLERTSQVDPLHPATDRTDSTKNAQKIG
jgi:hypothetical protein